MKTRIQPPRRPSLRFALAAGAIALFLTSASADVADNRQAADQGTMRVDRLRQTKRMIEARDDYSSYCASCHGEQGDGAGGIGALAEIAGGPDDVLAAIMAGHEAQTTAAWRSTLDEKRASAVADFIEQSFIAPPATVDVAEGEAIYARTCSVCHGEQGDGASWAQRSLYPAPIDFTSAEANQMSRQQMIAAASYGVDDTAMMPFLSQLSPQEIAAVVDYVRTTFVKSTEASASTAASALGETHGHNHGAATNGGMELGFPNSLVGDVERGRVFYEANCAECHGIDGQGDGRRAYFIRPKPRDFTSEPSRAELNREHLFAAVADGVPGREMPAWSKVIDNQQIADVAEYVFRAFVRPEPGAVAGEGAPAPAWQPAASGDDAKKKD